MDEIDKTIKEVEETMARFTAIEKNGKEKIFALFRQNTQSSFYI